MVLKPAAAPAVSVVIPVYNGERYLGQCLDSIFKQTCSDFEVIVVDDGSTDATASICAAYPARLVQQANRGQAAARNRGVALAQGRYIAFMDHDDYWHAERLARGICALEQRLECALVYSDVELTDESGAVTQGALLASQGDHPKLSLRECLSRDLYIVPSSVTLRRSVFEELGGFDESLRGYEDEEFFLRLIARYSVEYLPEPLVQWRRHAGGATHSRRFYESRILYLRKLLAAFPDKPLEGEYLASAVIAPRFFDIYRNDYLTALDGRPADIDPDRLREGMLLAMSYLPPQPLSLWLLCHVPYRLARAAYRLAPRLPLPWAVRRHLRPRFQRR
jgi:glycosyltransferase involved in cell wall biosynthesis